MKLLVLAMDSTDYKSRSHEIMITEHLAKYCEKVTLVCERIPENYENIKPKNIEIFQMPINGNLSWDDYNLLMERKYDVCLSTSITGAKWINKIAKKQNIPSIVQVLDIPTWRLKYDHWKQQWNGYFKDMEDSTHVIVNSKIIENVLGNLSDGKLLDKITVVYYGVASENADAVPPQVVKNQICFVSGLRFYKGLDLAIYALSLLKNPPKLVVVGVGDNTEMMVNNIPFRLVETANYAGIPIEFKGGVSDDEKFKIIKQSMFGIFPDFCDVIPGLFPLECGYCEKDCIVTDLPCKKECYKDTVEYIKKFDVQGLADKIKFLIDNPEYRRNKGKEAREWVTKHRTFKNQAEEILEVIKKLT